MILDFKKEIPCLKDTVLTPDRKAFNPLIDILIILLYNKNLDKENVETIIDDLNESIDDAVKS